MQDGKTPLAMQAGQDDAQDKSASARDESPGRGATKNAPILNAAPVLIWLMGAFWVSFILFAVLPTQFVFRFDGLFALSATGFLAGISTDGGDFGNYVPLIGHMFVHADLMHIGMNSLWFLAFGAPVASRLNNAGRAMPGIFQGQSIRKVRFSASVLFLAFFLLSGIGGALLFIMFNADNPALLVGASGGVSGLLGGLVRFMNRRGPMFVKQVRPLVPLYDPSVLVWSLFIVLSNIAVGVFGIGLGEAGTNIAWEAHIGGYFTGLITFPVFDRFARIGSPK